MGIKIRIFSLNSSYFLKAIWSSGNSFLKLPSSLIMIHPFSIHEQKLTGHFRKRKLDTENGEDTKRRKSEQNEQKGRSRQD